MPRVVPLCNNPLTRWSRNLRWPASDLRTRVFDAAVGMGGGGTAFNATNTVRTSLYFDCSDPPFMLNATSAADIALLQHDAPSPSEEASSTSSATMRFGEAAFASAAPDWPLVAFENYVAGAQSIHVTRVGMPCSPRRLVVGHENNGVDAKYLPSVNAAGKETGETVDGASQGTRNIIVYIPQFGTSSSLNVVTCLGIGLFYSYLDAVFPDSRTLLTHSSEHRSESSHADNPACLERYTQPYSLMLPHDAKSTTEVGEYVTPARARVDRRPIHPMYYLQTEGEIQTLHGRFLDSLYERKIQRAPSSCRPLQRSLLSQRPLFGLSVLYENEFDQRNLGGMLRNANAFLVDHVFYTGRKKLNIMGAVGCQHYSRPIYLGPSPSDAESHEGFLRHVDSILGSTIHERNAACAQFLLLSTGQEFLYTAEEQQDAASRDTVVTPNTTSTSHPESLRMFAALQAQGPATNICLTQPEASLNEAMGAAGTRYVVLLVPQEGKLPHPALMSRVEGILHVAPPLSRVREHRGLPSQVAGGIALARWCSVAHPELRW